MTIIMLMKVIINYKIRIAVVINRMSCGTAMCSLLQLKSAEALSESVEFLRESRDCVQNFLPVSVLQPDSTALGKFIRVPECLLLSEKLPEGGDIGAVGAVQHHSQHLVQRAAWRRPGDIVISQQAAGGGGGGGGALEGFCTAFFIASLPSLLRLLLFPSCTLQVLPVLPLQPGLQLPVMSLLLLRLLPPLSPPTVSWAGVCPSSRLLLCCVFPPDPLRPVPELLFIFIIPEKIVWKRHI